MVKKGLSQEDKLGIVLYGTTQETPFQTTRVAFRVARTALLAFTVVNNVPQTDRDQKGKDRFGQVEVL